MLVLTRKIGEKIRIGKDIVLTVFEQHSGQVRLGISAPKNIPIYREEVYNKIQHENRSSILTDQIEPSLIQHLSSGLKEKSE